MLSKGPPGHYSRLLPTMPSHIRPQLDNTFFLPCSAGRCFPMQIRQFWNRPAKPPYSETIVLVCSYATQRV